MEHHWKVENFGGVQMASWNESGTKVAVISHNKIARYEIARMCEPLVIPSRTFGERGKLLCCKWQSDEVLFFGGLFDCIFGVTQNGEIARTVRPFMRTRDMVFASKSEIYAISATRGYLTRYDLKEER